MKWDRCAVVNGAGIAGVVLRGVNRKRGSVYLVGGVTWLSSFWQSIALGPLLLLCLVAQSP